MVKLAGLSLNEQEFLTDSLKQGIRSDGRSLDQFRDVEITLGDQPGYVDVRLGKTRVAVRVSGSITKPYEDRPFEGIFTISTEIGPIAGAFFENGRPSDEEVLVSRLIEKAIKRSGALDVEGLCIVAGDKCWNIRADIHFMDFDGGFIDASCIGVITALQHFSRPEVTVSGEQVVVYSTDEREPVKLSILHVPICVTFALFNPKEKEENIKGGADGNEEAGEFAIVDATMKEEGLSNGTLTITMNKNKEICQISKSGGLPAEGLMVMDCANKAYGIVEKLTDQIKEVLKQ
ncbi:exosome non-catalytic core subunit [Saccharomycopsis crataegensis]|uniref:Exosome complex component RRP45 n=1 Tax=Saccharomycopsis crataegensis TaxID=43959 RepID=A0AAV5QTX5_9ASCO|nr:exosome non-catalytic core subunit [Saccharomycopsis crataegensis]